MAQTVAVQRGATTVSADGTSKVTLFTQSSGTATRVILNSLSVSFASSSSNAAAMLFINISGSGNYVPVAIRRHNEYATRYLAFMPSDSAVGSSLSATQTTQLPQGVSLGSTGANGWPSSGVYDVVAAVYGTARSSLPLNIVPANFWMANGDSLTMSTYLDATGTATILYHFVTVTES